MRIVLVSHNDMLGGAAIVTYRLMQALRSLGHEADMLVFRKTSNDPHVHQISTQPVRLAKFMFERIGIWKSNGFKREDLFKVSTASFGLSIHNHPLVKKADAILLGWINQGTLSLKEIGRLANMGKKILWTMHDMWCFTGICHHAHSCDHYRRCCGNCPYMGAHAAYDDLSYRTWQRKVRLYADAPAIKFVAVSNWVRDHALESSLLHNRQIHVIHNAFHAKQFPVVPDRPYTSLTRKQFSRVIAFGAARLDDPIKGLPIAIEALNIFLERYPEEAAGAAVVFFGAVNDPKTFDDLKFPHIISGTLYDVDYLQHLYCSSDVVLSTSHYESLSGTLIEGMSSGAVPVAFGRGGQPDFITHKQNGYIARYLDPSDIADGIHWAFNSGIKREDLHEHIVNLFDAEKIALKYINLIEKD